MKLLLKGLDREEWPDGTFGGPRPDGAVHETNPKVAAAHCAELLAALNEDQADRRRADTTTRGEL